MPLDGALTGRPFAPFTPRGPGRLEVIVVPEPGSKKHDTQRARRRKEAERSGISDRDANAAADEELQQDPERQSRGPRTERGRGPKGERPENA